MKRTNRCRMRIVESVQRRCIFETGEASCCRVQRREHSVGADRDRVRPYSKSLISARQEEDGRWMGEWTSGLKRRTDENDDPLL